MLLSITRFARYEKKEYEQQHRFLLLRSSQHCLLPGRLFCFTFVKQRANSKSLPQFFLAWLASFGVIGSSIVRSTPHELKAGLRSAGFRRHLSGYRLRSAGFRRHLSELSVSLRPTRFRRHLSGHCLRPTRFRRHLSGSATSLRLSV